MTKIETIQSLRILIVEDQSEARAMLRSMLSEMGITQVFEASNGREGLDFIDSANDFVDLVICDWNMPQMTGVEFLRKLRGADPDMPFLMITGRGDLESVVEAKSSGVTGYIRKPFSPRQLEAKMRIILQRMAA